ncbi:MAG: hypothetical protein ACKVTZ_04975 [Bacteroidia bacterium]
MCILVKNNGFSFLFLWVLVMSGCGLSGIDKVTLTDYAPEVAVPLIDANFTVQDLLDNFDTDGYVSQDNTGLIRLVYKGKLLELKGDSLFTVPDISPIQLPLVSGNTDASLMLPSVKGEKLSKIYFKAGNMKLTLQNPSSTATLTVILSLPSCIKSEQALSFTHTLAPKQSKTLDISMAGYRLSLVDGAIPVAYSLNSNSSPSPLNLTFSLSQVKYAYLEGNFPPASFNFPTDSLDLPVFHNLKAGKFQFTKPKMLFRFQNSFGMPVKVAAKTLSAFTQLGGNMNFSAPNYVNYISQLHEFQFAYPSLNEVGQTKTTTFALTDDNSNLEDILSNVPSQVRYGLGVFANPTSLGHNFFFTDSSRFKVEVEAELPIVGKANNVELRDTFAVNFEKLSALKTAHFKAVIANGFPISGKVQLYFCQENGTILDSMYVSPLLVPMAENYSNKLSILPSCIQNIASFNEDRFAKVKLAHKVVLKAVMSTAKESSIFNTASLTVKLGVISKAEMANGGGNN